MKMTKRAVNVMVFTVIALMCVMVFGYTFKVFHEINAMDLGDMPSSGLGREAADIVEDESKADANEIAAVKDAETVVNNCMKDEKVISSVRADYENHRMVYLMLADGTAEAAKNGDTDVWNKVSELGRDASLDGQRILEGNGLEGWDFEVEVLNDSDPYKTVLAFEDGECTYDCLAK